MKRITRPVQMFAVGVLFGLGFDTATEVALLALAGRGAAAGLPWYAVLTLPLLFAAGMSLMDTLDGAFMTVGLRLGIRQPDPQDLLQPDHHRPVGRRGPAHRHHRARRRVHDDLGWTNPVTTWISTIDLNNVGFVIVGPFVVTWA